ncbi:hypothetical protein ACSSS7_004588 [Eimeria intestinalis]
MAAAAAAGVAAAVDAPAAAALSLPVVDTAQRQINVGPLCPVNKAGESVAAAAAVAPAAAAEQQRLLLLQQTRQRGCQGRQQDMPTKADSCSSSCPLLQPSSKREAASAASSSGR